ncbi:MAG TPA: branched-chain amino acid ABC transporter permease [Alphaproteobacteria bacterium]|nr:branched-chain amino acid ABC transporter permease [Alphaproteobacteria bacterium]
MVDAGKIANADLTGSSAAGLSSDGWRRLGVLAVIAVALVLPWLFSNYHVFQFTLAMIYAIALLGLNLLTGYNGQISLGHGAFFAIGGYTTAILMHRWGVPYYLTIAPAGLLSFAIGVLFGLPALRLEGLYLALVTFSLAVAIPQILKYFDSWTGGSQGILLAKPAAPAWFPVGTDRWHYYLALAILLLVFWAGRNLLRSRTGRALVAIRDHPISAVAMGVNPALYKTMAFGVSALMTGIAGSLAALATAFVAPDSFSPFLSISFIVGSVVGGIATISGAVFGGIFIQFVPNVASDISDAAPWAIYGLFLLAFMYLMPQGIAGTLGELCRRLAAARAATMASRRGPLE